MTLVIAHEYVPDSIENTIGALLIQLIFVFISHLGVDVIAHAVSLLYTIGRVK